MVGVKVNAEVSRKRGSFSRALSLSRSLYEMLLSASVDYAKWDYEVSLNIIKNRKKLLILLLLLVPILAVTFANAGSMLGGKQAYAPAAYSTTIFLVSIAIGMTAGLITGCIGAGGGFIITPALMAVGVKGILAVGTDIFHIFAKAIMGATVHSKLGNVSVKLALAFLAGSAGGTFIGVAINKGLYERDPLLSEAFISAVYAVLLGFLGVYGLSDYLKSRKDPFGDNPRCGPESASGLIEKVQKTVLPPMIGFDDDCVEGGKRISGVFVALGGMLVGILASIMGVGGGFITFPMFVYVFGVSTATTVGTDILQIIFTAGIASVAQYAIYGYILYTLAMGMLVGSLIGVQVGALTTKVAKASHIRGFYAVSILAGFFNRASTLPKTLTELGYFSISKPVLNAVELVGNVVFWVVVGLFGLWVFGKFFANIDKLREEA
jgi:uncharacterized membrane protein YfcA